MDFLDKSQTFLGVLLALVALMLYDHGGNLFFELLKKINNDLEEEIRALGCNGTLASIKENPKYQKIDKAAKQKGDKKIVKMACNCRTIISLVDMRITKEFVNFQPQTYIDHCKKLMTWREIFMAPFYTFVFCILIFIVDETLRYSNGIIMITVGTLFWFILLSSILWFTIWFKYLKDAWRIQEDRENITSTDNYRRERVGWYMIIVITMIVLYIIGMWHSVSRHFTLSVTLCICAIEIIKGIFAVSILFKQNNHVRQLGYRFTMKHFVYVCVASFLISILLACFHKTDFVYPEFLFTINEKVDVVGMRCAVFCFVIINGLFLPFVFPLIFLWRMKKLASKEAERIRKSNNRAEKEIINLIDERIERYHLNF